MMEDDTPQREDRSTSYTLTITVLLMAGLVLAAWLLKRNAGDKNLAAPPVQADKGVVVPSSGTPAIPVGDDGRPRSEYQVLTNCRLEEDPANEGDTFRVHTPQGSFRFRLYWVQTVPVNGGGPELIREFKDHFDLKTEERLREIAAEAREFTINTLRSVHFRVITRWEKDSAGSILCFAYASDSSAAQPTLQNLALLLVQNGLAIIRPTTRPLPEPATSPGDFQNQLTAAETEARRLLCGGWAKKEG